MGKIIKLSCLLAVLLVLTFTVTACGSGNGESNNYYEPPQEEITNEQPNNQAILPEISTPALSVIDENETLGKQTTLPWVYFENYDNLRRFAERNGIYLTSEQSAYLAEISARNLEPGDAYIHFWLR